MGKTFLYQTQIKEINFLVIANSKDQARFFVSKEIVCLPEEIILERLGTMEKGQTGILAEVKA